MASPAVFARVLCGCVSMSLVGQAEGMCIGQSRWSVLHSRCTYSASISSSCDVFYVVLDGRNRLAQYAGTVQNCDCG